MKENDKKVIQEALDLLAVALTYHGHVWSDEERAFYDEATLILENDKTTK